ncbi:MAG: twin-arginine translocation signal domain-containing protein, partial [Planctomycetota bacterium]
MSTNNISRRTFIQKSSVVGAAGVAGALAGPAGAASRSAGADTSKILNYNPKMGYRRLGKTGLIISEVSLGGHWRAPWRDRSGG